MWCKILLIINLFRKRFYLMDNLEGMQELLSSLEGRGRNEAETRHKIIDFVLHDFLFWPKNRVAVEEYINPGFADYILKKENGEDHLFVEAKKEGVFFELPLSFSKAETHSYISIKKLLSDDNIKAAMKQVREYCIDTGCEFACITNGHEWIFFKAFEKGKRWESMQAFVIRSLNFFIDDYTKSVNAFSFVAIFEESSLSGLLSSALPKDRGIFYPKEKIPSYSHSINSNRLASNLRPIASRYFGVISDDDTDFMDKCYVSQREYRTTFDGIHSIIHDSLTPYLENFGVQQLEDTGKGGKLGGRLTKNLKNHRKGEVLVLFGGKGAGKSTLLDAICLALFGGMPRLQANKKHDAEIGRDDDDHRIRANDVRSILSRGKGEAFAEVDFVANDGTRWCAHWSVRRARGKATGRIQSAEQWLENLDTAQRFAGKKQELQD